VPWFLRQSCAKHLGNSPGRRTGQRATPTLERPWLVRCWLSLAQRPVASQRVDLHCCPQSISFHQPIPHQSHHLSSSTSFPSPNSCRSQEGQEHTTASSRPPYFPFPDPALSPPLRYPRYPFSSCLFLLVALFPDPTRRLSFSPSFSQLPRPPPPPLPSLNLLAPHNTRRRLTLSKSNTLASTLRPRPDRPTNRADP